MRWNKKAGVAAAGWLLFFLGGLPGTAEAQKLKITPPSPVVEGGGTVHFSANKSVLWSLAPGSQGSIDADGTYHAPQRVKAKQSFQGCQILPNNHIFNVRVDNLPEESKSRAWIKTAGGGSVNYLPSFPWNTINPSTPAKDMKFLYTPKNSGPFRIPPYPSVEMESGWFTPPFSGVDRHLIAIDPTTCDIQEMYNLYAAGANEAQCPSCTSQSGVRYSALTYDLPRNGSTDAASMFLVPLTLHLQEIEAALANKGTIQHALRFTISAPSNSFTWPALASAAYGEGDRMLMGARLRLRSNFDVSRFKNPATRLLLTQLKEYGLILADGGLNWQVQADSVNYPPEVMAAFVEVNRVVQPADLQVVDVSGLKMSDTSGETPVDAETVVATARGNPSQRAIAPVVLEGVTVGTTHFEEYIQVGAKPIQLEAWVNGTPNRALTWKLSAPVGSLSPTGLYTPPSSVNDREIVTATVSSAADPEAARTIQITVIPAGTIRINVGGSRPYKDSQGHIWMAGFGYDRGWNYDNGGTYPKVPDVPLYQLMHYSDQDMEFRFHVPNGNYRLLGKFAEGEYGPGQKLFHLETQGNVVYRNVDVDTMAGGQRMPLDLDMPAVVTDGTLLLVLRHVIGPHVNISSLEIQSDPGTPRMVVIPGVTRVFAAHALQFYSVGWFLPSSATWSINPPFGTIDANGLYRAPLDHPAADTPVTVTAVSKASPSISGSTKLVVPATIPAVRINCGGSGFTDPAGNVWSADTYFAGDTVSYSGDGVPIQGARGLEEIYRSSRYNYKGQGSFHYRIPLANGEYSVVLKWAEYRDAPQQGLMGVAINGKAVLSKFDPTVSAGGVHIAFDKTFRTPVTNGVLDIEFTAQSSVYMGAWISGIEAVPIQGAGR